MKVSTTVALMLVVILTLDALGECEGWFGRGSRRSSTSRSRNNKPAAKSTTVKVGNLGIRDRDKTKHRTGLGTLARKVVSQPVKTIKAVGAFAKSYQEMRQKNLKGGNLEAHRKANKKATEVSDKETAAAISALREQYKNFRVKQNPDKSIHIGDTRTKEERENTMNANERGRQEGIQG